MRTSLALSRPNILVRLVLSLTLGGLAGTYAASGTGTVAPVVAGLIAVALLLVPAVLMLAVASDIPHKGSAILRYALVPLAILVVVGCIVWVVAARNLATTLSNACLIYEALAVILTPGVAAFAFSKGARTDARFDAPTRLALGCALAAWLGASARAIVQAALTGTISSPTGQFSGLSGFELMVTLRFVYLVTALQLGLFGAWLRQWVAPTSMK